MTFDTTVTDARHHHLLVKDIKGVKSEHSASFGANAMQVAFKLDANLARQTRDLSSYVNATKMYHGVIYPEVDSKLKKELAKLLKDIDLGSAVNEEERVRRIEDHLKTKFNIVNTGSGELREPFAILKNKTMNNVGTMILFAALFNEAGIEHQIVVTSDRQNYRFDRAFESYLSLQREFFYFPSFKQYMAPTELGLRVGYIPAEYMDNDGLFIRTLDVGGVRTGIGKVGFIEPLSADKTINDIKAHVDLASDPGKAVITMENRLSGYYAQFVQPFYGMLDEENKKKLLDGMLGYLTDESESSNVKVEDDGALNFGLKPVILKAEATTTRFLEQAGPKTLFKIGELIGPQMELYADKERTMPVDDDHARRYARQIVVMLPAGTRVENLSALEVDRSLNRDGKDILRFHSDYTLDGDKLTVTVEEFYLVSQLPLADFEAYRGVVNAAADFNKVTLVLAKS